MALSDKLGVFRNSRVPGGIVSLQARPSVAFRPGSIVGHRIGSELAEIPLSASPRTDLIFDGYFVGQQLFTSSSDVDGGGGAVDADGNPQMVTIEPGYLGWFHTGSGVNEIKADNIDAPCFVYDDDTLYLTDLNGTLSFGGFVDDVSAEGLVRVRMTEQSRTLYSLFSAGEATPGATSDLGARAVATSLPAGSFSGGVYTATANGAMGTQDGVTMAVGDILFLPAGTLTTLVVSAANSGPYEITALGAGGAKIVLTRPARWADGAIITPESTVRVGGEGTLFKNTRWPAGPATAAKIVGTDDPVMYPDKVTQAVVLVAGHKVVTNVPIRHATGGTNFLSVRLTADTCTLTTGGYHPLSIVAGGIGTASVDLTACVAAGTINVADVSTMLLTIVN